jgi:hypothetical protein
LRANMNTMAENTAGMIFFIVLSPPVCFTSRLLYPTAAENRQHKNAGQTGKPFAAIPCADW